MKSYKKILLTAAASLIIGTQAFAAEKLRIGTEGAYPPFNLIDASGKVVGFDLDIAHALCAKMQTECEVVTSDWDGIIPALNAGKFDFLAASMSVTEERKNAVDFTDHYYTNKLQFVAPKSTDFKTDKDYLDGKVIGAQRATIAGTWLEDNLDGVVDIKLYDTGKRLPGPGLRPRRRHPGRHLRAVGMAQERCWQGLRVQGRAGIR